MKENKIFVNNFYEQNFTITLESLDNKNKKNFITGFHGAIDSKEVDRKIVSEIFKALLLHDKVVISTTDMLTIVNTFGIDDAITLVKSGKFEFGDDNGLAIVLGEKPNNKFTFTNIRLADESGEIKNSIEWLEYKLVDKKNNNNKALNVLLTNIEKYNKILDVNSIDNLLSKEMNYDLLNSHVSKYLDLSSQETDEIDSSDAYSILRLGKLNKTLIYSSILGIDNIAIDAEVKPILGAKLSPILTSGSSVNLFDSLFQDILQKKKIPDLANLYIKDIISIDDYLQIVNELNGKKFRHWINQKEYNPEELERDIINSTSRLDKSYLKYLRWGITNAIGLLGPVEGLISSAVDSFLIERLMQGWHPNLFLDDVLKIYIDKKIKSYDDLERMNALKRRFPNIGRNDKCPCGSGSKFKKVCGA